MKYYSLIFLLSLVFIGCTPKQIDYTQKEYVQEYQEQKVQAPKPTQSQFDFFNIYEDKKRVAIVFPSKVVGKYANGTINTIISYLLYKNEKFDIDVIDSSTEEYINISNAMNEVIQNRYSKVILLFTEEGLPHLNDIKNIDKLDIYMPIIHKDNIQNALPNITFGGMDYKEQIQTLKRLSNGKNTHFYGDTVLGNNLRNTLLEDEFSTIYERKISASRNNYKAITGNELLVDSTLFLNTSIIKTSILLSQLTVQESSPYLILSTQLNFTPLIVSLTQYPDRKSFLIANSIEKTTPVLEELVNLLDGDVVYNWVNYSSLIGIDYLYNNKISSDVIVNRVVDNQVQYNTTLYKNTPFGFKKY